MLTRIPRALLRRRPTNWTAIFLVSLVCSAYGLPAFAESEADRERWIPGLSIYTVGLAEERGATATNDLTGFQDGETTGFSWSIGAEGELASPVLFNDEWNTRLVVHGGGGYVLDADDPITTTGDPGSFPAVSPFQPDADSIENQGTAVRAQAKPWVLTGGVGAQVEVPIFGRTVYFKPSLEWMYRKDTIQGILGAGELETPDVNGNCGPCRLLFINAEREKGYHSMGFGLDASVDGGRSGPLRVRAYASARFYYILGDRKSDLVETGTWFVESGGASSRSPNTTTLTARYEREPIHYRIGVGLRFEWAPDGRRKL